MKGCRNQSGEKARIERTPRLIDYFEDRERMNLVAASFNYLGMPTRNYKELHRYDKCFQHLFKHSNRSCHWCRYKLVDIWQAEEDSIQQDRILQLISELEQKNAHVLMRLEKFAEHHEDLLNQVILLDENILKLDEKIQSLIENDK